jgi:2-oxoglutarate ferredoxin oxidoreductase subunit delta
MAKGRIIINEERCKGCSLCIGHCPVNILALDATRTNTKGYAPLIVTDESQCIACSFCAMMCPDSVITVERFLTEEVSA